MSGFVYFADIGDAITKIGHAECVGTRFDQHRKMYGDGIKLMFAVRGSTERERGFHKFFAQYRMERPSSKTMTVLSKTYRLSNGRKGAPGMEERSWRYWLPSARAALMSLAENQPDVRTSVGPGPDENSLITVGTAISKRIVATTATLIANADITE